MSEAVEKHVGPVVGLLKRILNRMEATPPPPKLETRVEVKFEPLTYSPYSPHSFFRDLVKAQLERDPEAQDRLHRHQIENELETISRREPSWDRRVADIEYRVNPNAMTAGQGQEFAPPWWLVDRFASGARAGRPLADLCNPMFLPRGVSSVHIPRMTTASIALQMSDGAPVAGQDLVTVDVNSIVATIAGQLDVSQQLFDQSPQGFDTYAYIDLTRAYNRALELQMLTGSGSGNQLLGLSNVSVASGNSVSGSGDTAVTTFWPHLGQVAANIGNNRFYPPEVILMAPRRWFWLASSVDNSNRPVASPGPAGAHTNETVAGGIPPVGRALGLPVYADGAIAAGSTADTVYFCRPSDMYLWEGDPMFIAAVNPISETLQVRLSIHRAVAWIPHRYPSGTGFLTGVPQPSNF